MAAATPPEIESKFIRFSSWRILPEEQYAKRMRILRELSSATEGTCTDQFWKVMGQVDDWEWEDMDPGLLPKDKNMCIEQVVLPSLPLGEFTACQSPPPGSGIDGSLTGTNNGAASSSLPFPSTPAELLDNSTNVSLTAKAERKWPRNSRRERVRCSRTCNACSLFEPPAAFAVARVLARGDGRRKRVVLSSCIVSRRV